MYYFHNSMTEAEAKTTFRKLSLKLHPDKGGNMQDFIKMQEEYEKFLKGSFDYTEEKVKAETTSMKSFFEANKFTEKFENVIVELTGTWVWLSGNTQPYKEEIKENGFRWSKAKKKWYKAPYKLKGKRKGIAFNKIKAKYGYESIIIEGKTKIA